MPGEGGAWMGAVVLILATVVVVTTIVQVASVWRSRTNSVREQKLLDLTESINASLLNLKENQKQVEARLASMESKLGMIERMLSEVE